MTQQDLEYRSIYGVVPQLDFFNGGHSNISAPPVQYTRFAFLRSPAKMDGGRLASGAFGLLEGALHMATGNFGYGIGKTFASGVNAVSGFADPHYLETDRVVSEAIQEWEQGSWRERYFLANFVPAAGCLGDIVCSDGAFSASYCGRGHRFFTNGDYFEGMFVNGRISQGLYILANGARYLGCFDESLHFSGLGTLFYAGGGVYHGNFVRSKREGVGAQWYPDGVYVGYWANDMRNGSGFLRLENGTFYDGTFYNDQRVE